VLRDAESHALVREIVEIRMAPSLAACRDVLGTKLGAKQRALLQLALGYFSWRTLVRDGGLKSSVAARTMAQIVVDAAEP